MYKKIFEPGKIGTLVGAETASYLAHEGRQVSILEMLPEIARDGEPNVNHYLLRELETFKVSVYTSAKVVSLEEGQVTFTKDGVSHQIGVDTVILAAGIRPEPTLWEELKDCGIAVFRVGNASETKNGFFNIRQAFQLGRDID